MGSDLVVQRSRYHNFVFCSGSTNWDCFNGIWGGTGRSKLTKLEKVFLQKLGSDLVVQSSRQAYPAQNFELYHMGMVSGVLDLMLFAKVWFFMIFGPFY